MLNVSHPCTPLLPEQPYTLENGRVGEPGGYRQASPLSRSTSPAVNIPGQLTLSGARAWVGNVALFLDLLQGAAVAVCGFIDLPALHISPRRVVF